MMDNNYTFRRNCCTGPSTACAPLVYASSGSVYGAGRLCREESECEDALNVYAYSKLQFDRYVRRLLPRIETTVVGLRYFNVYGPGEQFKGKMASMVHQLYAQLRTTGVARLFTGSGGYGDGEQRRDFVFVRDVVAVNLFFAERPTPRGYSTSAPDAVAASMKWPGP